MQIEKAYNYKTVNDLESCSGTLQKVDFQSFADKNYEVVINLLPDDSEHAVQNEQAMLENIGISYTYIPVDWKDPKPSDFEMFSSVMNASQGRKTHIHCAANYRATAFYGLYAYMNYEWSKNKVNDLMSTLWKISDYPIWEQFVADMMRINDEDK
jgi:protein tyrosine phosphatase (PTP) superfamily phosphohydrolase (DUF442 family)